MEGWINARFDKSRHAGIISLITAHTQCGPQKDALDDSIGAAIAGDREALGELLKEACCILEGFLADKISNSLRASIGTEDVIQVTYLEAFLRIGQLRTASHVVFLAWLKRIAENNLRDAVRELGAKKRPSPRNRLGSGSNDASFASLLACLTGTGTTPTGHAARQDIQSSVKTALAALPPVYEQVVREYDLEGISILEVAKSVKKSPAAVHMLRARAHDRLREMLSRAGDFFTGSL